MSEAVNVIAEGEVQQLMNCNDPNTTEDNYMQVIYSKTARLFEAATQVAAILADAPENVEVALQDYGRFLGTAFQLIDDVLDYNADGEEMGGKMSVMTLPRANLPFPCCMRCTMAMPSRQP